MHWSWTYHGDEIIDFDDTENLEEMMIVNDDDENKEEELLPDRATANGEIFGELQECVKQRLQVLEYKIQN